MKKTSEENNNKEKYLVVHGHFYQPPRENPWLEEIEIQNSAYPFHDWNERINAECYMPNAFSKIFETHGKIINMVNNYEMMSFNFGPTLLSWLEKTDKDTYRKIINADKVSMEKNNGHGNAIAQVYNHIIMPLANEEDKDTQIKWGISDFVKRFKRKPEGMWLAETAIDYKTVDALIANNINYTILSPYQAQNIRKISNKKWIDVLGGRVDATKAYRCYSKIDPKKYLDIFFYDGPISSGIGFEDIVEDSGRFLHRLKMPLNPEAEHVQIVNVATDGETYGHHKKFSDLTLAHMLFDLSEKDGFIVSNYANFLEKFPPEFEVELNEGKGEGTAWSCAHGVDRWKDDCGCCSGMNGGWNQKWRKPLRDGLNELRDKLKKIYEHEASKYLKDVWKARNNYIDVVLNRDNKVIEKFFEKESKVDLAPEDKTIVLKLMEIQRNAMLMFTSCGWFFDDISGIETQQILMYAAKAIKSAQEFTNEDIEEVLLKYLRNAKSNLDFMGTGEDIYLKHIKAKTVDFDKIVAHYGITSLFQDEMENQIYTYEIEKEDSYKLIEGNLTLAIGKLKVKDLISFEFRHMIYGVLRFGNLDFRCSVKTVFSNTEYIDIKKEVLSNLKDNFSIVEAMRSIDIHLSRDFFTFKDLLMEEKRKVLKKVTNKFFEDYKSIYEKIYIESSSVVEALSDSGLHIPEEYRISAEYTLSTKITDVAMKIVNGVKSFSLESELVALLSSARKWKYSIKTDIIEYNLKKKLNELTENIEKIKESDFELILRIYRIAKILGIGINTNYSQFKLFNLDKETFKTFSNEKKNLYLEVAENMGFLKEAF